MPIRKLGPRTLIEDGDISADVTSEWVNTPEQCSEITITVSWSGTTPVGQFLVEADTQSPPLNAATAKVRSIPLTPVSLVSGNTGSDAIVLKGPLSRWRLKYSRTSGTGTMQSEYQAHAK